MQNCSLQRTRRATRSIVCSLMMLKKRSVSASVGVNSVYLSDTHPQAVDKVPSAAGKATGTVAAARQTGVRANTCPVLNCTDVPHYASHQGTPLFKQGLLCLAVASHRAHSQTLSGNHNSATASYTLLNQTSRSYSPHCLQRPHRRSCLRHLADLALARCVLPESPA